MKYIEGKANIKMDQNSTFRWLHLSDLHIGMGGQKYIWPSIKRQFFADIEKMAKHTGGWDVVVFSGDLTQRASKEEFSLLNSTLKELWSHFSSLNTNPYLFCVPGNHDLMRPPVNSATRMLGKWWIDENIQNDFWNNNQENEYFDLIKKSFDNYTHWHDNLSVVGIPTLDQQAGIIPGDSSARFVKDGISVGLIGLNSSWLQLDNQDYEKKLHLDIKQIMSVTGHDIDSWLDQNNFNFLVTHHPESWLHPDSLKTFHDEINSNGRFHAHLHGHMHDPLIASVRQGGGETKRTQQAPSLFGLEEVGRKNLKRIHGYYSSKIDNLESGEAIHSFWPRTASVMQGGGWKIHADQTFHIDESNCLVEAFLPRRSSTKSIETSNPTMAFMKQSSSKNILADIEYPIFSNEAHNSIRELETKRAASALAKQRMIWVTCEWGIGGDEFLSAVQSRLSENDFPTFRLDLNEFASRNDYLEKVQETFDCSFAQLCDQLSAKKGAYLILDDIPNPPDGNIVSEIEGLVGIVLSYCEDLKIVARSRADIRSTEYDVIILNTLDEADTYQYIVNHPKGYKLHNKKDQIAEIYRLTDGVPSVIDQILRELEVSSIGQLALNGSFRSSTEHIDNLGIPVSLKRSFLDVSLSESPKKKVAFELLKVLSIFPQGQVLENIERFIPDKRFWPEHALLLLDGSLVKSQSNENVNAALSESNILLVHKSVREIVLKSISSDEYNTLIDRATALYFGPNWKSSEYKPNNRFKFDSTNTFAGDMENATAIIKLLLNRAMDDVDKRSVDQGLGILSLYVAKLEAGSHYREITVLCNSILGRLPEDLNQESIRQIKFNYAKALRMIKEIPKSMELMEEVIDGCKDNALLARAYLSMAMASDSLDIPADVKKYANKVIEINPKSSTGIHAKTLLIGLLEEDSQRMKKLYRIESYQRREGNFVIANNIRITLAGELSRAEDKLDYYMQVIKTSQQDPYNGVRAIVLYADLALKIGRTLSVNEKKNLHAAYQFLYSQRMSYLFNKCHAALWNLFMLDHETDNLLKLCRHSSLVWRLNEETEMERNFVEKIFPMLNGVMHRSSLTNSAYLIGRAVKHGYITENELPRLPQP